MSMRPLALVTGGNRNIGKAIVLALARDAFDVAFTYLKQRGEAELVCAAAKAHGRRVRAYRCDTSSPDSVEALAYAVEEDFGRVTALVNNAGVVRDVPLVKMTDAEWFLVTGVNLDGVYRVTRRFLLVSSRAGRKRPL